MVNKPEKELAASWEVVLNPFKRKLVTGSYGFETINTIVIIKAFLEMIHITLVSLFPNSIQQK